MNRQTHQLKTWPVYFQRCWDGDKTFEIRIDDRGYQKGDTVVLREWDRKASCVCPLAESRGDHADDCGRYSGRTITARIGFVMASTPPKGSQRGFVGMGYVVFSLCEPKNHDGRSSVAAVGGGGSGARVEIFVESPPVSPAVMAQQVAAAAATREARR